MQTHFEIKREFNHTLPSISHHRSMCLFVLQSKNRTPWLAPDLSGSKEADLPASIVLLHMNYIQWHQIETLACLLQFNFPRIPRDIHNLVKFASWVSLQPLGHTYNPIMRNFSILNYQWSPKMTSVGFSSGALSYHFFILVWWPPTESLVYAIGLF